MVVWLLAPYFMAMGVAWCPRWLLDVVIRLSPSRAPREMRHVADTLRGTTRSIFLEQAAALRDQPAEKESRLIYDSNLLKLLRKFMSAQLTPCLIVSVVAANSRSEEQDKLSDEDIVAQMRWIPVVSHIRSLTVSC